MGHIRDKYDEIEKRGAGAVSIMAESLPRMQEYLRTHSYPFPVLSDVRRQVVKAYGVWVRANFESVNISRPAEVIVSTDKTIEYMYIGWIQTDFPTDEELFAVLERLQD